MLTLCSESLHRVHMASSVSLSIMEHPAVLQTAPFGNTSDSLLAVLLLMQAKSMELQSQRYGTSEKGCRDPWATTRTFGYQIKFEISCSNGGCVGRESIYLIE